MGTQKTALILILVILPGALPPCASVCAGDDVRWPDETALPKGAVRLGSTALRFKDGANGVAFLGDGSRFAALIHNRIRIFDTATAKEVRNWQAHDDYTPAGLVASNDGKRLVTAGNTIRIWDADTGKLIREFKPCHRIMSFTCSRDGKYLASYGDEYIGGEIRPAVFKSEDYGIRVHDTTTGAEVPAFQGGIRTASHPRFTADGKHLMWSMNWQVHMRPEVHMRPLAGGMDRVWDADDTSKWIGPTALVSTPRQVHDFLVFADNKRELLVWDGNKQHPVRRFPLEAKSDVGFIVFSPESTLVASSGTNGAVTLWDLKKGTSRTLGRTSGDIHGLEFARDGKTLIACGSYNIRLWDVGTGLPLGPVGHHLGILGVAISSDHATVATASRDGTVRLWDRATGKPRQVLAGHAGEVTAVTFHGDATVASAGADGTIRLWNAATGQQQRQFMAHKGGAYSLVLPPSGKLLASGGDDGKIRIWDTTSWREVKVLEGLQGRVMALVFSHDGQSLYSGSSGDHPRSFGERREHSFRLWNLATGKETRRFDERSGAVRSIALSPNGKLAVSNATSRDQVIGTPNWTVWETATGKALAELVPLDGTTNAVAFAPDGKTLAFALGGYKVKDNLVFRDTTTWKVTGKLHGHLSSVSALVYSADGRFLVSASEDSTAVVWDLHQIRGK